MEPVQSICLMRALTRALAELESALGEAFSLSLNEAMTLCAIAQERVPASFVSEQTGLSASLTSRVVNALEDRGFVTRSLGREDRRQVFFELTSEGSSLLARLKEHPFVLPEFLQQLPLEMLLS